MFTELEAFVPGPIASDPRERANAWRDVEVAVEAAAGVWSTASPETYGPIHELLEHARWNAAFWNHRGEGLDEADARRRALADLGRGPQRAFIDYEGRVGRR